MPERTNEDDDRRRSPRFSCAGHAKISCLPSDGIFLPGQILDLSLGGCCVDTTLPIDHGVRAEIVLRVNAASFRAVGEVRAIRGRSAACVEFVHLSAGGKDILADLVRELARLQAIMNKLKFARREMDTESFRRQLEAREIMARILSTRFPLLATVLPAENLEGEQTEAAGEDAVMEERLVVPVNLFG